LYPTCFRPALAKHSKSFSLIDCISVGVDPMQRNFEPMRRIRGRRIARKAQLMAGMGSQFVCNHLQGTADQAYV
jgi:hypothetical protein